MLKLVLGNKNYSSWSMRPWFAMRVTGIAFEELVVPIYQEGSRAEILKYSPSGKVPVLIDNGRPVWDSLSIIEYVAERHSDAHLWPDDPLLRAEARSISAEMHGGFLPLRRQCGMNMHRPIDSKEIGEDAKADIARILAIWTRCRQAHSVKGPFLFGRFSAADAMFAPVVSRFETYAIDVPVVARAYMDAIRALPAWSEWKRAALSETWRIAMFEDDPA